MVITNSFRYLMCINCKKTLDSWEPDFNQHNCYIEPSEPKPLTVETIKTEREKYMLFHKEMCEKMHQITLAKNSDYTGGTSDPFENFTRVESLGICTTEQGFLTRMTDKLCRIASFVKQGTLQVKTESVEDTLLDLANYAILMAGYLKLKK